MNEGMEGGVTGTSWQDLGGYRVGELDGGDEAMEWIR